MVGVDPGGGPSVALQTRYDLQCQSRFPTTRRTEDFYDSPAGEAADPQGFIE
jgi:hypothetical protein